MQILDVRPRAPRIFTVEIILNPLKEGKQIKSSLDKKISSTVQKSSFPSKAQTSVTNTVIPPVEKSKAPVPPKERSVKKFSPIKTVKSASLGKTKIEALKEVAEPPDNTQTQISSTVQKSSFPSKAQTSVTNTVIPPVEKSKAPVPPKERSVKKFSPIKTVKSASLGKTMDQVLKPKLQNKTKFGNTSATVPTQTGIPEPRIFPPRYAPPGSGNALPKYPRLARRRGLEGRLMLRVFVSPEGKTENIKVIKTSGHLLLDQAAQNAVKLWKFEPAPRAGVPVSGFVNVPVIFKFKN